ncbi:MAG: discoidin domain-containing protein [Candidatus Omnitrophota bacterium]
MRTVIIEIYKSAPDQFKMNAFYKGESLEHKHYTVHKISESGISDLCSDIFNVISRADSKGLTTENSLEELRKSANLLYEQVFSKEIKDEIKETEATHLIFYIDEQLVHIPWELLYDGSNYLCLRFATGRVVLTVHKIHTDSHRTAHQTLKMLSINDPTSDLKNAYEEGILVRNELDRAKNKIQLELRTAEVDTGYIMKNLREYDIFHFAGHAKYDEKDPSKSGLVLSGGDLTAERIMTLSDSSSMPLLVFANACSSGETEGWRIDPAEENRIYGLANVFLLAGVKHYIGTFWKIQDGLSMHFSRIFYRNIRLGRSIGEALRQARLRLIEKYGLTALIWASYMLYGDPGDYLIAVKERDPLEELKKPKNLIMLGALIITLSAFIWGSIFGLKEAKPLSALNVTPFKNVYYVKKDGVVERYDEFNILGRNIAAGKEARASSADSKYQEAEYAVDNNLGTRWSSLFRDPQWIYVDLKEPTPIGYICLLWQTASGRFYKIQISDDSKNWKTVWFTKQGGGSLDVIDLTKKNITARFVRMYGEKRTTEWGYSLFEFRIYPRLSPNIALGKKAFASSGSEDYAAKSAVDGIMGTRWGSGEYFDPQWIYVDLGEVYKINMIDIQWEYAYGSNYIIQRSDDAKNWIDVCEIKDNNRTENHIYFEKPFTARYVRLYGKARGTDWGYSIWELQMRGFK